MIVYSAKSSNLDVIIVTSFPHAFLSEAIGYRMSVSIEACSALAAYIAGKFY